MEIVFEPKRVREVLCSAEYPTYPMADVYEHIMHKTGLDFSATVSLLRRLPVFLEGAPHADVRRRMALVLASGRRAMEEAVQRETEALADRLFAPGQAIDLVADFARPIWLAAMGPMASAEDLTLGMKVSTLFDPQASPARRRSIDEKIGAFLSVADSERLTGLCLAALGYRPFVGSFALSIYETIARRPGASLSRAPWGEPLPVSAVRFLDRIDKSAAAAGAGTSQAKVRCHLHHSSFEGHSNTASLFGHGAHICLGKALTELAWRSVCRALARLPYRAEAVGVDMNPSEEPFYEPLSARIVVCEPGA